MKGYLQFGRNGEVQRSDIGFDSVSGEMVGPNFNRICQVVGLSDHPNNSDP